MENAQRARCLLIRPSRRTPRFAARRKRITWPVWQFVAVRGPCAGTGHQVDDHATGRCCAALAVACVISTPAGTCCASAHGTKFAVMHHPWMLDLLRSSGMWPHWGLAFPLWLQADAAAHERSPIVSLSEGITETRPPNTGVICALEYASALRGHGSREMNNLDHAAAGTRILTFPARF